jgi:protein MpaA
MNPDGFILKTRTNINGVDLNRNLPTKDWSSEFSNKMYYPGPAPFSEPENKALVSIIEKYKPKAILTLHSFTEPQINANGNKDSGVIEFAEALYKVSSYKKITIGDEIGYSTPGCLGTYAGFERNIQTITYELPVGVSKEQILLENIAVINRAIEFINTKTLLQ